MADKADDHAFFDKSNKAKKMAKRVGDKLTKAVQEEQAAALAREALLRDLISDPMVSRTMESSYIAGH